MAKTLEQIHEELLPLLKGCADGRVAIALGGSLAKNLGDSLSDIDYYLFADAQSSEAVRKALVEDKLGKDCGLFLDDGIDNAWGGVTEFNYEGYRVETSLRSIKTIAGTLGDCMEGNFEIIPTVWNPNDFYSYVLLSDIYTAKILYDPDNILKAWQADLAVYPPALKKEIILKHSAHAKFWIGNFHFQSAIKRKDLLYVTGIVQDTIHHLCQVLYAVNGIYYPGDKKNIKTVGGMKTVPAGFVENAEKLLKNATEATDLDERLGKLVESVTGLDSVIGS
jgi:hypothetical protein